MNILTLFQASFKSILFVYPKGDGDLLRSLLWFDWAGARTPNTLPLSVHHYCHRKSTPFNSHLRPSTRTAALHVSSHLLRTAIGDPSMRSNKTCILNTRIEPAWGTRVPPCPPWGRAQPLTFLLESRGTTGACPATLQVGG